MASPLKVTVVVRQGRRVWRLTARANAKRATIRTSNGAKRWRAKYKSRAKLVRALKFIVRRIALRRVG